MGDVAVTACPFLNWGVPAWVGLTVTIDGSKATNGESSPSLWKRNRKLRELLGSVRRREFNLLSSVHVCAFVSAVLSF